VSNERKYVATEPPQSAEELSVYLGEELRRIEAAINALGERHDIQFVDATANLSAAEVVMVDTSAGSVTITLPGASASLSMRYRVLNTKGNSVIIRSTETINGVGSSTLSLQYQQAFFITDGIEWFQT